MTYKEIVKKIEYYEKKHTEAFMIYYDHEVTEAKQRMYDTALNRKNAALSALLDFCRIYRNENKVKYLEDFYAGLEVIKSQAKAKNEKTKLEDLEEFEAIYKTIIDSAFALEGKDFLKLVKYGEEKEGNILKKIKKKEKKMKKILLMI